MNREIVFIKRTSSPHPVSDQKHHVFVWGGSRSPESILWGVKRPIRTFTGLSSIHFLSVGLMFCCLMNRSSGSVLVQFCLKAQKYLQYFN